MDTIKVGRYFPVVRSHKVIYHNTFCYSYFSTFDMVIRVRLHFSGV